MPQPQRQPALAEEPPPLVKTPTKVHPLAPEPPAQTNAAPEVVVEPRPEKGPKWEELNQRFTTWVPRALIRQVKAVAKDRNESVAAFVTRALWVAVDKDDHTP